MRPAPFVAVVALALASTGSAQDRAPGPPALPVTTLVPNAATWAAVAVREGEVTRSYDGLADTSEVWMKIVPAHEGPGDNPTTLFFSAVFKGRRLRTTPDRVWVRAQSNLTVHARRLRSPTLALTAHGATLLHVIDPGPGDSAWLNYPCHEGCTFDGVVAALPIVQFFRLLDADRAFGEALGFPFTLTNDHLRALGTLATELVPASH
jgi:hypothetical protein